MRHPPGSVLVKLSDAAIAVCGGDTCAAALLDLLASASDAEIEQKVEFDYDMPWIELVDIGRKRWMGAWSRSDILRALNTLEAERLIDRKPDPGRELHVRLRARYATAAMEKWAARHCGGEE